MSAHFSDFMTSLPSPYSLFKLSKIGDFWPPLRRRDLWMTQYTDYGHPDRVFFQKFETFGLGHTNWAEILWGIWDICGQTISTFLALWVPCPWESVAGSLSYKKLWFLGLNHVTPKRSQNKIWAVKNLGNFLCSTLKTQPNCIIARKSWYLLNTIFSAHVAHLS